MSELYLGICQSMTRWLELMWQKQELKEKYVQCFNFLNLIEGVKTKSIVGNNRF